MLQKSLDESEVGACPAMKRARERYEKEFRPNLVSGAERLDLTLNLWIEMCWPPE